MHEAFFEDWKLQVLRIQLLKEYIGAVHFLSIFIPSLESGSQFFKASVNLESVDMKVTADTYENHHIT